MRIVTGHDYYDSALAFGRDTHVVFVRHKDKIVSTRNTPILAYGFREGLISLHPSVEIVGNRYYGQDGFDTRTKSYKFKAVVVYFCGKKYNGITLTVKDKFTYIDEDEITFWTYDSFLNFINGKCVDVKGYYDQDATISSFFDRKISKNEFDFLIENKYTILISQYDLNSYNSDEQYNFKVDAPELKKIQFYKVVDAYTAFQEISMWVGGTLSYPGNTMITISDKDKIHKHGFDKWSFRKMSEKKK